METKIKRATGGGRKPLPKGKIKVAVTIYAEQDLIDMIGGIESVRIKLNYYFYELIAKP